MELKFSRWTFEKYSNTKLNCVRQYHKKKTPVCSYVSLHSDIATWSADRLWLDSINESQLSVMLRWLLFQNGHRSLCTILRVYKTELQGSSVCRSSRRPRDLRRESAAARLLGLRVRIPPGAWTSVSCECCVLSGRGIRVGLITRPEES